MANSNIMTKAKAARTMGINTLLIQLNYTLFIVVDIIAILWIIPCLILSAIGLAILVARINLLVMDAVQAIMNENARLNNLNYELLQFLLENH